MAERFSETHMLRLIEIYKEYDSLWDVTHELYKNKDARERSYKKICQELNIPGLKARDIPQKIKNLRSSYYQEMKKIEHSVKEGATGDSVYKPKVSWFPLADGFLRTFHKNQQEFLSGQEAVFKRIKTIKKDITLDRLARIEEIADNLTTPQNITPNILQTKNERTTAIDEDEFDSFGKYMAVTLRCMPIEMSIIAKTELQKTLSEIQLRAVRKNQPLVEESASTCELPSEYILSTSFSVKDECEN